MPATPEAIAQAQVAASAADDKLATDIVAIDVSEHLALTDIFVIASAPTERQIGAIVDEIEEKMREQGRKPLRREGEKQGTWILLDFGDIIAHVMTAEDRMYYQLERLWKDCPDVPLELPEHGETGSEPGASADEAALDAEGADGLWRR
ncbi:MAG: ribosome silencing factor [Mobilicoccus sp.]|nr:ribosome silencing factor [Mobilicoccus sp.]